MRNNYIKRLYHVPYLFYHFRATVVVLSIIYFFAFLTSCKKPDTDPQTKDFIYNDLKAKLAEKEALKVTHETNLKDLEDKLADEDPQSIQQKVLRRKISMAKWEISKIDQMINYYKIKILEREKYVRTQYYKSFEKDEHWNNDEEVLKYKKGHGYRLPSSKSEPEKSSH